ncbi:MAG: leucyl/phenylalanyl-tRNA--protein transferase [Saprospiraceae bacterium]|nr:leucyl/phenylalanyl-tRNA--protein transferase [Saprospiraceae bacterium]
MRIFQVDEQAFPFSATGLRGRTGLVGTGGKLETDCLLAAYSRGIFPWYPHGWPVMWFSPAPRLILRPEAVHISHSMRALIRKKQYRVSVDLAFSEVIGQCQLILRDGQPGTWIHNEVVEAFTRLHLLGLVHSVEVWEAGNLVGGLYGLAIGRMFCGESMFSIKANTSKLALVALCYELVRRGFLWVDCQQDTDHLKSMGAGLFSRKAFDQMLVENRLYPIIGETWVRPPAEFTLDQPFSVLKAGSDPFAN